MTRGPAGYGRYNDDPEYVGCPRAKSDMTPCIARDGSVCLSSEWHVQVCVGCGNSPGFLMKELARAYEPAKGQAKGNPRKVANTLRTLVRQATEP